MYCKYITDYNYNGLNPAPNKDDSIEVVYEECNAMHNKLQQHTTKSSHFPRCLRKPFDNIILKCTMHFFIQWWTHDVGAMGEISPIGSSKMRTMGGVTPLTYIMGELGDRPTIASPHPLTPL